MKARIVFMFSGQGSQYYQMGKELLDNAIFSHWMQQGEKILERLGQPSFLKILYENKTREAWSDLFLTHPGLVIIEYAVFQLLKSLGVVPDAVLGFSIGELSAAAVAGALTFEEAVIAAYEQAKLVVSLCSKGGMTAVLSSPEIYSHLKEHVQLGGVNYAEHFLITGSSDALEEAHLLLKSLNKTYIPLPVNYAFHSEKITVAQIPFQQYCQTYLQLNNPEIPFISGLTGLPLKKIPPSYFWDVVHQPLSFQRVISILEERDCNTLYLDLGPSGTLAAFVKNNLSPTSKSSWMPLLTPFHNGKKNIERLLISLKEERAYL